MGSKIYDWLLENINGIICLSFVSVGIPAFYCSLLTLFEGKVIEGVLGLFSSVVLLEIGAYLRTRSGVYEKVLKYLTFFLPWVFRLVGQDSHCPKAISTPVLTLLFFLFLSWLAGLLIYAITLVVTWILLIFIIGTITFVLEEDDQEDN